MNAETGNGGRFRAWYRCIAGCPARQSLEDVVYRCPLCGGLLEVAHDMEALASVSAQEWRSVFDGRLASRAGTWGSSGVWSKREWVHPGLEPEDVVSFGEGNSALVRAPSELIGSGSLWVKQC